MRARAPSTLVLIAIVALACALSLPALGYEYVYDDKTFVVTNSRIQNLALLPRAFVEHTWAFDPTKTEGFYYRPLLTVWLALGHHLFGGPTGPHALAIVLHAVAIVLVYRVGRALALRELACVAAAAVFALHPIQIQAVTFISAANDPLIAVCLLGALLCWIRERRVAAIALFVAATLVIERAFPFVLVPAWFAVTMSRDRLRAAGRALLPFAAALGAVLLVRALILHGGARQLGLGRTLATLPSVLLRYGANLAWPSALSVAYPETPRVHGVALGVVVVLSFAAVAFVVGRTRPQRAFLVGALAIMLAVPLQVALLPGYAIVQDRYLYVPLAFAALLVADLLFPPERQRVLVPAALGGAWLLALVVLHPRNHSIWRNDVTLYARAIDVAPNSALFVMNYANALKRTGIDDQCALLLRARDAAARAPETADLPLLHYNLGNCLREHGRARDAVAAYDAALATAGGYFTGAALNRTIALLDAGALDDAASAASELTNKAPQSVAAWRLAGVVAARRSDFAFAVACFERAKALAPNDRSIDELLARARRDAAR